MPPERSPPRNRFKAAKLYCCFFSTRFQCKSRCQTAAGFTDTKILAAAAFQNWSSYLKSKQEKWNSKMEELLNKFFFISSPRLRLLSKEAAEVKVDSLRRARRQKKTSKGRERRTRGEKKCLLSLILLSCSYCACTVHSTGASDYLAPSFWQKWQMPRSASQNIGLENMKNCNREIQNFMPALTPV